MRTVAYLLVLAVVVALAASCRATDSPPGVPSEDLVAGGQAYLAQCAVCHGVHGGGDGPLAGSIEAEGHPRPARLEDGVRMGDLGREGVRRAIEGASHARPRSPMPVWGPHLGPPWMDRIAAYVATLPSATPASRGMVERYLADPDGAAPGGRRTYVLYCSGCHGADGEGPGYFSDAVARRMSPAPLQGARLAGFADEELERRIGPGGAHAAEAATMPGWIHTIAPAERRALTGYLRTLKAAGDAE